MMNPIRMSVITRLQVRTRLIRPGSPMISTARMPDATQGSYGDDWSLSSSGSSACSTAAVRTAMAIGQRCSPRDSGASRGSSGTASPRAPGRGR